MICREEHVCCANTFGKYINRGAVLFPVVRDCVDFNGLFVFNGNWVDSLQVLSIFIILWTLKKILTSFGSGLFGICITGSIFCPQMVHMKNSKFWERLLTNRVSTFPGLPVNILWSRTKWWCESNCCVVYSVWFREAGKSWVSACYAWRKRAVLRYYLAILLR